MACDAADHRVRRRSLFGPLMILGLVLMLSAIGLRSLYKGVDLAFEAAEIRHLEGQAYQVDLRRRLDWPWELLGDHMRSRQRSPLRLYDEGRLLGPAHAFYDEIVRDGGGAYMHWRNVLIFSTPDQSDPRANQRRYTAQAAAVLAIGDLQRLALAGLGLLCAAGTVWLWQQRQQVVQAVQRNLVHLRRRRWDYALAAAVPSLAAILVAAAIPYVWNDSDSTIWLIWEWQWAFVPQHPPLYPALMALATGLAGHPPGVLWVATTLQLSLSVVALTYLATAFRVRWQILLLSTLGTVGSAAHLYSYGLLTEGLANPWFVLFLGAVLRLHRDGLTRALAAMLIATLLAAALTRHAFLVFAMVPVILMGLRGLSRPGTEGWRRLLAAGAALGLMALVVIGDALVTQSTCLALDVQCRALTGRTGVYRMQEAYKMVPAEERADWLARLMARAPDPAVAEAIELMVMTSGPWVGPNAAIAARAHLGGGQADRLMNEGFRAFWTWPDRFVLAQWRAQLFQALFGPRRPDEQIGQVAYLLHHSAHSIARVYPADPRNTPALAGLAAADPQTAEVYRLLAQRMPWRGLDAALPLTPGPRARLLLLAATLSLAAMYWGRLAGRCELLATLWLGVAGYAIALTLATVVLPRYLSPLDLLLWLIIAIASIALGSRLPGAGGADRSGTSGAADVGRGGDSPSR